MYTANIQIKIHSVKGSLLTKDQRIHDTIAEDIIGTLTKKLETKFETDGIKADVTSKVEWED